jgi:hypothetical protein
MLTLAVTLRNLGADVRLCAPPDEEIVELLDRNEIRLPPALASVQQWVERVRQSGMGLPQLAGLMIPAQCQALSAAAERCDAVVATGLSLDDASVHLQRWKDLDLLAQFARLFVLGVVKRTEGGRISVRQVTVGSLFRLRVADGAVHIIPLSAVTRVTSANCGIGHAPLSVNLACKGERSSRTLLLKCARILVSNR